MVNGNSSSLTSPLAKRYHPLFGIPGKLPSDPLTASTATVFNQPSLNGLIDVPSLR